MIGRGLVVRPDLARQIRRHQAGTALNPMSWQDLQPWLADFFIQTRGRMIDRHSPGRIKQWLSLLTRSYPQAQTLFDQLRRETSPDPISLRLQGESVAA
jgi:tRNA-dihydrouridine synthase C